MRSTQSGRGPILVAGVGLGVALGAALGMFVLAPNTPGFGPSADTAAHSEAPAGEPEGPDTVEEDSAAAANDAVAAVAPALVANSLNQRPVIILRAEPADPQVATEIGELSAQAGAIDAGEITLTEKFFDPAAAEELDNIVAETLPEVATSPGEMVANALLLDPDTAEPRVAPDKRAEILTSLREAGFIDYEDGTILPAQGIIVLTGGAADNTVAGAQSEFAFALDSGGAAVVVAGPFEDADDGALAAVRSGDTPVSTVDTANESWAQISTVLALAEQIGGGFGHYGVADNADATIPSPEPEGEAQ